MAGGGHGIRNGATNAKSLPTSVIQKKEGLRARRRQILCACAAHWGALIMATVWSWSSTALPSLREDRESLGELDTQDEAWIASITFLAGAAGSLITGFMAEKTGLKMSLLIATVPLILGWFVIQFATNLAMILGGRFLTGFWVAGVGVSNPLVAEFSKPSRRGRLNFLFDMFFCVGVLYIYIVGTFLSWRLQAALCSTNCIIFFILLLMIPESPRTLLQKGKENEALKALVFLRDLGEDQVRDELLKIQQEINSEAKCSSGIGERSFQKFLSRATLKPILIGTCLQFFLQMCGVVPIVCYAPDVFKAAGTVQIHENVSTIVLGAINLGATFVAYFFVDKYGRRILLMGSEAFLTVTLFVLGIFLYLKDELNISALDDYSWFILVCFVIFITAYSFGVGPLPWVIMGEIVPPNVKGFASGLITLVSRIFGFLIMFFFNNMTDLLGQHGMYWLFSIFCALGFAFTFFFLPETKGRTLEEIQTELQRGWLVNRKREKVGAEERDIEKI